MTLEPDPVLLELLADHALEGLDGGRRQELDRRLSEHLEIDAEAYERAAAAIHLALLSGPLEPLPAALRARLEGDARRELGPGTSESARTRPRALAVAWTGWLAAAALLVALVSLSLREGFGTGRATRDPAGAWEALAKTEGSVVKPWEATSDPLAEGVSGEVLWNEREQRGFMRFIGLARNDPSAEQYQLWIFDSAREAEHPVDGGVFDVRGNDVVVPIEAKLAVYDATLFAVTLERPGGVVVSRRDRLLLTAPL